MDQSKGKKIKLPNQSINQSNILSSIIVALQ